MLRPTSLLLYHTPDTATVPDMQSQSLIHLSLPGALPKALEVPKVAADEEKLGAALKMLDG
jgi:hypothetical protein